MKKWLAGLVVGGGLAYHYQDNLLGLWGWLQDSFVVILLVILFLFIGLGFIARWRQAVVTRRMEADYNRGLVRKPSTQVVTPPAPQVVYQLPQGYGMNMPAQPQQGQQAEATFIELPADRIELL